MTEVYALTDGVSEDEFEDALAEARDEQNLSRANVVRKVTGRPPASTTYAQNRHRRIEVPRQSRDERADLIAELEATLTPDVAHQVEAMLEHHTRRPSIISHVSPSRSSSSTSIVPPSRSSSSTSILPAAEQIQPFALPSVADRHSEEGDGVLDNEFDCVVP